MIGQIDAYHLLSLAGEMSANCTAQCAGGTSYDDDRWHRLNLFHEGADNARLDIQTLASAALASAK